MKNNLKELDTFIYIDASNIKNALKVSGITLNFTSLIKYFKNNYKNLKSIKYFEGIDKEDTEKTKAFEELNTLGYELMQ